MLTATFVDTEKFVDRVLQHLQTERHLGFLQHLWSLTFQCEVELNNFLKVGSVQDVDKTLTSPNQLLEFTKFQEITWQHAEGFRSQ